MMPSLFARAVLELLVLAWFCAAVLALAYGVAPRIGL